ncbi:hypothetical protein BC830DRAFT_43 [Chytriomyces sp. MP71]|nr:hypothetical protein BC830DRAFT_43 [Chytriomyces sp. MP71]
MIKTTPVFLLLAGLCTAQTVNLTSTTTNGTGPYLGASIAAAPSSTASYIPASPISIPICGSATVADYGVLPITSALLTAKSSTGVATNQIVFTVMSSPNLQGIPTRFTQDDVNNGRIFTQPTQDVLTQINSNTAVNITLQAYDPLGHTAQCNIQVTIQYTYAPYINVQSTLKIATQVNQPIVITSQIYQLLEYHGLSTWNLNVTSVGFQFNQGGYGLLEVFKAASKKWEPLTPTSIIPYEWIDMQALRYNPNGFIGSTTLVLQASTGRGFTITPWLDLRTQSRTLNTTIQVTSAVVPTVANVTQPLIIPLQNTPNPPDALMKCYVSYPTNSFPVSTKSPFGPYCVNFTTTAGVSTTFTSDFLGATITLTTISNAIVYFGTSVYGADYIDAGSSPLGFAGYLDYGAFYLYVVPPTAVVASSSIVFTTPEIYYDEAVSGISSSQITVVDFDPVAKTHNYFFVTKVSNNGPPQITLNINPPGGMFILTTSSSNSGSSNGTFKHITVAWAPFQFDTAWVSRTFTYPLTSTGAGILTITIRSATDLLVNLLPSCNVMPVPGTTETWIPGGYGFFDCFTIDLSSNSANPMNANVTMSYSWTLPMTAKYNYNFPPSSILWG